MPGIVYPSRVLHHVFLVTVLLHHVDLSLGNGRSFHGPGAVLLLLTSRESFIQQGLSTFFLSIDHSTTYRKGNEGSIVDSTEWTGTALTIRSLNQAVSCDNSGYTENWPMARWPDPVLRHPASEVSQRYFKTDSLKRACALLRNTARKEGAVGLAAEQCGVDARIIFLERSNRGLLSPSLTLINPRIVERSPEEEMKVWRECCLVLPPTFSAIVFRDAWVVVQYQDENGAWHRTRLFGEAARAFQHEFDHDRGILITDHVGYDEMDEDGMVAIEARGHSMRMAIAYSRETEVAI